MSEPEALQIDTTVQEERGIEEQLDSIPQSPGVYLMRDADEKAIYVGKALNLRTRVRSYFRESGDQRFTVSFLRAKVTRIETIVTDTEKEALLLENLLIKKHKPRYNVRLRDDATYISLRLDLNHEWPRVHRIRRKIPGDKALYFGPYSSSQSVKHTLRFIQRLFPLRSCPDHVLRNRSRPCILHQIDRCCAPCVNKVDPEKYAEYVDQTILFLNGKKEDVIDLLRGKMEEYSEELAFEKAAVVRDKIQAIQKTVEQEKVASHERFDRDVIAFARGGAKAVVVVFPYRSGNMETPVVNVMKDTARTDGDLLEAFMGQYYETRGEPPREIFLSTEPENREMLLPALEAMRDGKVTINVPARGEKKRLVEMAEKNARLELEKALAGEKSKEAVLKDLERGLRLPSRPTRIECFDISNFQGSFVVGSMTCFIDGEPEKTEYRHYKVRSVEGQNDFASMREVLSRRFSRALREGSELPDLLVIDGGKGQLNIAVEVLKGLELLGKVPVCGLAKSRILKSKQGSRVAQRSEERVFLPNRKLPVVFDQSDPALFILTRIRDEAHRFGITYHRKLRNKASLRTGLEEIPGVGAKRRQTLIRHFGSLIRLRRASIEEIAQVQGVNQALAEQIHRYLHANEAEFDPNDDPDTMDDDSS